jgi:hypothetical protein
VIRILTLLAYPTFVVGYLFYYPLLEKIHWDKVGITALGITFWVAKAIWEHK